jgi:hypothetical protein
VETAPRSNDDTEVNSEYYDKSMTAGMLSGTTHTTSSMNSLYFASNVNSFKFSSVPGRVLLIYLIDL